MNKAFIYWDNSNIYIGGQEVAAEREGDDARYRVRIHFRNLLELARAGREVEHAVAVGSVPPELRHVWNGLEREGVAVHLLDRGAGRSGEQGADATLQSAMLRDALDYSGNPGTVVMLTGDGSGFHDGVGFHADLERMHSGGWGIEVLSWRHSCNNRIRQWAEQAGKFVELDDFYESITFLEPPRPGDPIGPPRHAVPVDLSNVDRGLISQSARVVA